MVLTDSGRSYVDTCKQVLEIIEEAERAATGEYSEPKGQLTVTAPISFGRLHLLPIVLEFLTEYPNIDIRLILSDRTLDLLEENIGLAIRIGKLPDSSLIAARIGSTRIVACASPSYLATCGRPEKPEDLSNHHCITFDNLGSPDAWRFVHAKGESLVPIRSRLCVNTAEAAIDAAIAGMGVLRMMSYKIEDARRSGALEFILDAYEPEPWAITMIYPGQGSLPHKLRSFLNFAAPRLRARIS